MKAPKGGKKKFKLIKFFQILKDEPPAAFKIKL